MVAGGHRGSGARVDAGSEGMIRKLASGGPVRAAGCLILALVAARAAFAQPHLIPDVGLLGDYQEYEFKLRNVFAAGYTPDVVLRTVILQTIRARGGEELAGVRQKSSTSFEAFVMTPSSRIWDTELVRLYEAGRIRMLGKDGKNVPLKENTSYQELKRRTPSDYRKISANSRTRSIPGPLAKRLSRVWQAMLLGARQPSRPNEGTDGITYHFSMRVQGYGVLSGHTWTPETGPTKALADLAHELASYASGQSSEASLETKLRIAEQHL